MKQPVRRARDLEGKAARRDTILRAAERLFAEGGDALPTVSDVALASGLAKGTVYLYFTSQAHIFLTLLLEGWAAVLARVAAAARDAPSREAGPIVSCLAAALRDRPDLLRLDAYGSAVLERQADPATLRAFKLALVENIVEAGNAVRHALDLTPGDGERLLMNSYAFARGLWQTSAGGTASSLAADDRARDVLYPDDPAELERALLAYWRGELAGR